MYLYTYKPIYLYNYYSMPNIIMRSVWNFIVVVQKRTFIAVEFLTTNNTKWIYWKYSNILLWYFEYTLWYTWCIGSMHFDFLHHVLFTKYLSYTQWQNKCVKGAVGWNVTFSCILSSHHIRKFKTKQRTVFSLAKAQR